MDKIDYIDENGKTIKLVDITGQRFGKLLALHIDKKIKNYTYWKLLCDCGNNTSARLGDLRSGKCKSCGCGMYKYAGNDLKEQRNEPNYKRTYQVWIDMMRRCNDPERPRYKSYGERGIKVCDSWHHFPNFVKHVGLIPKELSIERIDVNGNYCPENVILIPIEEQYKNKTDNYKVTYNGEELCLADCIRKYGLPELTYNSVHSRLKYGWTLHEALTTEGGIRLKVLRRQPPK